MTIPQAANKVPMMYRAQIEGRSQLQRLVPKADKQDATRWAEEWVGETYPTAPQFSDDVATKTYKVTWRFVTNGGQDDGIIRPVIGARGWPFYPGSSMKGLFRQACTAAQAIKYCGDNGDLSPGILRFHGGYPTTTDWTKNLVDIVHPQQNRQVKAEGKSAAFIQISLHEPELKFGISSSRSDAETNWETVWQIWERAIASGLGCRVSAGYGQAVDAKGDLLYAVGLQGQGQAPKLIDDESGEFRPNVFRAGIRGHALRIFGGLTSAEHAEQLIEQLFGGISGGGGTVGLLSMAFQTTDLELSSYGTGSFAQPTYEVAGTLRWLLTQPVSDEKRKALILLIASLTRFAMLFGGFGKSWRRADHRLFYPEYYDQGRKPLIGCHWQWSGNRALVGENRVRRLSQVAELIEAVRQAATDWMALQGTAQPGNRADWRESWHPHTVEVWGRLAEEAEDSEVIRWLHGPYQRADRSLGIKEQTIKQTSVTGSLGKIGRLWHRMYPWVNVTPNPDTPKKPNIIHTGKYFELLTLFPDSSIDSQNFLDYLDRQDELIKLWPQS